MKRRRWARGAAILIVAVVAVLAAKFGAGLMVRDTFPAPGDWTSTAPYAEAPPGAIGLVVRADGRVQVTGTPPARMWWAAGGHDLRLRGDRVEVRAGGQVVGELRVRHRAGELRVLDPACPDEALRLRKL